MSAPAWRIPSSAMRRQSLCARLQPSPGGSGSLTGELIGAGGEASFTVIDMGPYGVDSFQPPLIPGQRAALAVGRTVSRPGDGGSQQYLTLSLTYDPQKLDGIAVSSFLSTVRDFIQEPFQWLTW